MLCADSFGSDVRGHFRDGLPDFGFSGGDVVSCVELSA